MGKTTSESAGTGANAAVVWMYGECAGGANSWGTCVAAARFSYEDHKAVLRIEKQSA